MHDALILKLDCPDAVGLLARITGFVAKRGGNFLEVHQYTDPIHRWFFSRFEIESRQASLNEEAFRRDFQDVAIELKANWSIRRAAERFRTAVLVSKEDHCLADLLWRWRTRELNLDVAVVIGNHEVCRPLAERENLPFVHLPVGEGNRERHFEEVAEEIRSRGCELIVLARYMQILPDWFCQEFAGKVINIHHSFLPAFVGANPYRQAFERGVKLIGATCHYATEELDAGPIIEQEVARVEHFHDVADLKRLGRDCEKLALARGLRFHTEGRVLVHGHRAIVFRD